MLAWCIGACFSFVQQIYNHNKINQYYNDMLKKIEYDYKMRSGKEL